MPTIRVHGSRAQVISQLKQLGPTLAGKVRDTQGVVPEVFLAMGLALLGMVHQHYDRLSQGGAGDDGTVWPDLSPVTLSLRTKVTAPKIIHTFIQDMKKASGYRQRMFKRHLDQMNEVFGISADSGNVGGRGASAGVVRTRALRILERMKPYISEAKYAKTKNQLELIGEGKTPQQKRKYFQRVAIAAASALILRDTGRLFNSLNPMIRTGDQVMKVEVEKGAFEVGSNVDYLKYHQSPDTRQTKEDGTPILPRRNPLPDVIPAKWVKEMTAVMEETITSASFMAKYLGGVVVTA